MKTEKKRASRRSEILPIGEYIRQAESRRAEVPVRELMLSMCESLRYRTFEEDAAIRLKACPFCGSKAVLARFAEGGDPFVMCTNHSTCGAMQTFGDSSYECAELWNQRASKRG